MTNEVDVVCATCERLHGVTFGDGDAGLGGARTAPLPDGGMLGVRNLGRWIDRNADRFNWPDEPEFGYWKR